MTTPAQAAARAENGRRHSTGPKTTEGKASSRANAIKHGGYATAIPVIPRGPLAEDPAEWDAFRTEVLDNLSVDGAVETSIGEQIAATLWRSRRAPTYEAVYLAADANPDLDGVPSQSEWIISRCQLTANMLRDLDSQTSANCCEVAAVEVGHFVGLEMADDWPSPAPADPHGWISLIDKVLAEKGATREQAALYCEERIQQWIPLDAKEKAQFMTAAVIKAVDDERLTKTLRVEAHLGRELSRTMGLLRTLQHDRRRAPEPNLTAED